MTFDSNGLKMFKQNFIIFMDELIEQYPQYSEIVIARIAISNEIPIDYVVNFFIENLGPHQSKIEEKNDAFFLNDAGIFKDFNQKIVGDCKKMWKTFDGENKDTIWEWILCFIKLSKQCQIQGNSNSISTTSSK